MHRLSRGGDGLGFGGRRVEADDPFDEIWGLKVIGIGYWGTGNAIDRWMGLFCFGLM